MALQINTSLTTKDGGDVLTASHVKLEIYFPMEGTTYNTSMKIWRNEQAYIDGFAPIKPVEIPSLNFNTELPLEEYTGLTPIGVHIYAKAYLEKYVGEGNVEIIFNETY
jgi:hypothetical protein